MSELLCERCGSPALVIYEQKALCGPCGVDALDDSQRDVVVLLEESGHLEKDAGATASSDS